MDELRQRLGPDRSSEQTTYDGWGRATNIARKTAAGATYFSRTMTYTSAGKLQNVQERGDGNVSRTMTQLWDGGGRATRVATIGNGTTGMRIRHARFDDAERLQMEESGEGADPQSVQPFEVKQYQGYGKSDVATTVQSNEPRGTPTPVTIQRSQLDTLGRAKSVTVGELEWKQTMDQAGNVTGAAAPRRPATTMDHDAGGLVTSETLADGSVQSHSGAATAFADPTSEQMQTDVDAFGRPRRITYADSSTPTNCVTPPCATRTLPRGYGYDTLTSQLTRMAASLRHDHGRLGDSIRRVAADRRCESARHLEQHAPYALHIRRAQPRVGFGDWRF
jgi:YD repeat-containing protein